MFVRENTELPDQLRQLEESAEVLVKRRYELHKFFVGIVIALGAAIGTILLTQDQLSFKQFLLFEVCSLAGITAALIWERLVVSILTSIEVKLLLIETIEEEIYQFPTFKAQHELKKEITGTSNDNSFAPLSDRELVLPRITRNMFAFVLASTITFYFLGESEKHKQSSDEAIASLNSWIDKEMSATQKLQAEWEAAQKKYVLAQQKFLSLKDTYRPYSRFGENDEALAERIRNQNAAIDGAARELEAARNEMLEAKLKFTLR